jgi:hypothetical protein
MEQYFTIELSVHVLKKKCLTEVGKSVQPCFRLGTVFWHTQLNRLRSRADKQGSVQRALTSGKGKHLAELASVCRTQKRRCSSWWLSCRFLMTAPDPTECSKPRASTYRALQACVPYDSEWSSGQSSWLHNGDVLCFLWGTNWIYIYIC